MEMMARGWHLISASLDGGDQWHYMLGRPDIGLPYDKEVDAYTDA